MNATHFVARRISCRAVGWSVLNALIGVFLLFQGGCHVAATGHNLEGRRLYEQGEYNSALASFQEALNDDPENADAYYNIAAVYHRLGADSGNHEYLSEAEELYRRTIERDSNHVDAYRGLAVLYMQTGNESVAFNLIENWVIRSPQLADPRIELARLYTERGDPAAARDHLASALAYEPTNSRALRALGQIHEEQGNYMAALGMYERAFVQNNLQPDLAEHLASLRQSVGVSTSTTTGGGTRMVNAGAAPVRY